MCIHAPPLSRDGAIWTALTVVMAIIHMAATSAGAERLPIAGRIVDEQGQPVAVATVYVSTAGVRAGTSPYCPSCYADCGKRAVTDSDGRYTIDSLDSQLVFNLVAVGRGYRPAAIVKVDPQLRPELVTTLVARPVPDDPRRVVRGQVIDPFGRPTAGALVEPFGCKTSEKRWWGSMPLVDPLAVTDEQGHFTIVCDEPVDGLDVEVKAKAAVPARFALLAPGVEVHQLKLETGATLEGRVVKNGQPVPGVSIGVVQVDRDTEKYAGHFEIGTDEQGRFSLPNVPAGQSLSVYGVIDSLRDHGAIPARVRQTEVIGVTQLGDLSIEPALSIQGRIVLSDGGKVPAGTRVMFSRDQAWDSTFVVADEHGAFAVTGLPGEVIQVFVTVPGYRISAKNGSFEPLNGSGIKGAVDRDINNLVVLLEPGKIQRPDYGDQQAMQAIYKKCRRLDTEQLWGVTDKLKMPLAQERTTAPVLSRPPVSNPHVPLPTVDEASGKALRGTVVDEDGNSVADARIWLPGRPISALEIPTIVAQSNSSGEFLLDVPESWLTSSGSCTLLAYAPGRAIGTYNARHQLLKDNEAACTIELPIESELAVVVVKPDGTSAEGATIEPCLFRAERYYQLAPPGLLELIAVKTDANGLAKLPALTQEKLGKLNVNLPGYGQQRFDLRRVDSLSAPHRLTLAPTARVEGRIRTNRLDLAREVFVTTETQPPSTSRDAPLTTGFATVRVEPDGTFVIPEIAHGLLHVYARCDERLPVRPRMPAQDRQLIDAGETIQLEISLELAVPVHGVVRVENSHEPVAGATVSVSYGAARQGDTVTTDKHGRYRAYILPGRVQNQLISLPRDYAPGRRIDHQDQIVRAGIADFELPPIDVAKADNP